MPKKNKPKEKKEFKIPKRYVTYGVIFIVLMILGIAISRDNSIEREDEMKDFGEEDIAPVEVKETQIKEPVAVEERIVDMLTTLIPITIFIMVGGQILMMVFRAFNGGNNQI